METMESDWRNSKPTLVQAVSHIFETGLYSDLTFRVGPQLHKFNAHKVVVMSRSEVFAVMFQDRWNATGDSNDSNRNFIDIPHSDPQAFGCFLKYLYTDVFKDPKKVIETEVALEVLHLAHFYQVGSLVSESCQLLISKINLQSCVQIYQATRLYSDQLSVVSLLSESAFDFIKRNITSLLDSPAFLGFDKEGLIRLLQCDDIAVDETELFKAILKWSEHEECLDVEEPVPITGNNPSESRKMQLESLTPLIRFPLMGAEKFIKEVLPSKILSPEIVIDILVHFNGAVDDLKFSTKHRLARCIEAAEATAPTLPSHFKLLKCYDNESQYCLDASIFGTSSVCSRENNLSFSVNTAIVIRGLRFYGVRRQSVAYLAGDRGPTYPSSSGLQTAIDSESIDVKIYKYGQPRATSPTSQGRILDEVLVQNKWNKVITSEQSEFNLLFNIPAKVVPGVEYFINMSFNARPQQLPTGIPIANDSYSFSVGEFIQRSRQVLADPLTMTLKIENTSGFLVCQGSRMVHSIIYTIE